MPSSSAPVTDDDSIRAVVVRLARPVAGGGHVIERAAISAAGADCAAIEAWIVAHAGTPERIESTSRRGLHGDQVQSTSGPNRAPRRFVLPIGVL